MGADVDDEVEVERVLVEQRVIDAVMDVEV